MSTPRAYRALQAEIDEGIKSSRISSPITNAEANGLPYLQGVILENLRLYPPFTGLPFKVVPPGGETIEGKHVPAGTLIAPNMWSLGRNKDVFGPDADVFRPERWLDESVSREERTEMRRVVELVFGYGRWGCAGKMIAFLELNKVFVEVCRVAASYSPSRYGVRACLSDDC
jgi:cytochrome P450